MNRPDPIDAALRRFRRRAALVIAGEHLLRALTWWGLVWGAGVLVLKALGPIPPVLLVLGWAGVAGSLVTAALAGRRRRPPPDAVRALLDRRGGYGGLLMAREDADADAWEHRLPPPPEPRLRWAAGPRSAAAVATAAFALGAWFAPVEAVPGAAGRRLDLEAPLAELAEDLEALQQEDLVEEERAEALERELERLGREASAADPAAAWEALDQLREELDGAAAEGAEEIAAAETALAAASLAAESLAAAGAADPPLAARATAELGELLDGLGDVPGLDPELAGRLSELAAEGNLSPEAAAALLEALGAVRGDLADALGSLRALRLTEARLAGPGEAGAAPDADEALLAYLDREGHGAAAAACRLAGRGGSGAVNRGPGHVELTWKDPSAREGVSFREEVLPPSARLDRSRLVAADRIAPDGLEAGAGSSGPALVGAAAGGGSAQTQTVLPRHRAAVRRYFDPASGEEPP